MYVVVLIPYTRCCKSFKNTVKMNKLIIDNRTELTDIEAITLVSIVIKKGRISNDEKQYVYGTVIAIEYKEYMIWTDLNKKSDRFVITNM